MQNGAVFRKHMGFGHIAAEHAEDIGRFYRRYFNPYLNSIGRNGQPERMVDERGKAKYVCRRYATRWETLCALSRALPEGESCLKAELSDQALDLIAKTESDSESAGHMPEAKRKLFLGFREERKSA